jgi:hypothetical protein
MGSKPFIDSRPDYPTFHLDSKEGAGFNCKDPVNIKREFFIRGNQLQTEEEEFLERVRRFELPTNGLGSRCATTALHPLKW